MIWGLSLPSEHPSPGRGKAGALETAALGLRAPPRPARGREGLLAQGPRTGAGDPQLSLQASVIKHDFTPRRLNQQVLPEARDTEVPSRSLEEVPV